MNTLINNAAPYILPMLTAGTAAFAWFRILFQNSVRLGLMDKPDHRKVHARAVPVMGGLMIAMAMMTTLLISPALRDLLYQHNSLTVATGLMLITGVQDDRKGLSAKLRLGIQLFCAGLVAHDGFRLTSLHGFLGIGEIPLAMQYALTMLLITGLTNAYNLIDGIDGLLGSLVLTNMVVMSAAFLLTGAGQWLSFTLPLMAALIVFLRVNNHPAQIFMGDGGSMTFGFLMAALGIMLAERAEEAALYHINPSVIIALVAALFMLPVLDALRVFTSRMRKGMSPTTPDKTHMHHKLLKLAHPHNIATRKMLSLHLVLIASSVIAAGFFTLATVAILNVFMVMAYTLRLNLANAAPSQFRFTRKFQRG